MNFLMIVLRLIHIFSGVFWAGFAFFSVTFLQPAIKASGPEGNKVMLRLSELRLQVVLEGLGALTVLSGLAMYWLDSGGLQLAWITTGTGLGFTFGAVFGLGAFSVGIFVARLVVGRLGALRAQIAQAGKPPTPEQQTEMGQIQMKAASAAYWTAILLALALAAMATARYLNF